ncbi:regulatory protein ToxS [Photobacterium japonica]|uniref:regulatory protein ToxS n=1 Tax=Photobacterium japonica TaxID=2910235 RepID=UPI003D101E8A
MSVTSHSPSRPKGLWRYAALMVLALSVLLSAGIYFSGDYKQAQLLMSQEWQTRSTSHIEATELDDLGMLRRVDQNSHVVYLPNHTYSRITLVHLFSDEAQPLTLHISESGKWDISGGYLLTEPVEFKDITSGQNQDFKPAHLAIIKQIYRMDAQQSRRLDVLNKKAILLTSLTYGSNILYAL